MKSKFMPSADSNEKSKIYSKTDSIKAMNVTDTNKIIQTVFSLLLHKYLIDLEQRRRDSNITFDCVSVMYYECH